MARLVAVAAITLFVAGCDRVLGLAEIVDAPASDAPRYHFEAGECPPEYGHYGTSCYRFVFGALPWLGAEAACEADAEGAHLAIVNDVNEASTIDIVQPPAIQDHWVGVSDLVTQGAYLDVTGQPATFLLWEPGSPNGDGRCLRFTDARLLDDFDCAGADEYVCEYDGVPANSAAYRP